MARFTVTGYEVGEQLGSGWAGELWAARGGATGRAVVLRRLVLPDDIGTRDRVRREAAAISGLVHPHVVQLRGALSIADSVILVSDFVEGQSLSRLLLRRGHLPTTEVVDLALTLAQALAAAHDIGLVHGRVTPSAVLVDPDGRPHLADVGLVALLESSDDGGRVDGVGGTVGAGGIDAAADVRALAATCRAALDTTNPDAARLRALLDVVTASDSTAPHGGRWTSHDFAEGVSGTQAEVTQVVVEAVTALAAPRTAPRHRSAEPSRTRRVPVQRPPSRLRRRWVVPVLGSVAVVMAVLTGVAWARSEPGAPASEVPQRHGQRAVTPQSGHLAGASSAGGRPEATPANSWPAELARLDRLRAAAFAHPESTSLTAIYAPGAPAGVRDRARLRQLVRWGLHVESLDVHETAVRLVRRSSGRVVLRVHDVLAPYELRAADGRLIERRPGRGPASWTVTLARVQGGWRMWDVASSSSP